MTDFESQFQDKMNRIISKLGINEGVGNEIITGLQKFATTDKTAIIDNVGKYFDQLLEQDKQLQTLFDTGALSLYKNSIQNEWNAMTKQLAELQGLIILKKVHKNDCDGVIKQLLAAITGKLSVVNDIIKNELSQAGGNNDLMYKSKYLKYKTKYLNLMKK
jgi:transcription initiation factor TFIIIB Brf1 subunit/transcription initiation factor TFIIB